MERDEFLATVSVMGEISNFKRNSSGHLYFSLKDEGATVSAVMFRGAASRLAFLPYDGMKVTIHGRVSLYEKSGQYQVYAETMTMDGEGELARAYERLKRKLEAEGLFDLSRKRPIPRMPKRIGIVTSPTGAAIRDMLTVTGRRYPLADILLFPSAVQGAEAPMELLAGIEYFGAMKNVDVIIIGRGGGSVEDLWAFNDERLVRAVAASEIPVISAVGHEVDFTLCDFAADKRAPTPSAAAELAVPDVETIFNYLIRTESRLFGAADAKIRRAKERLRSLETRVTATSPAARLENSRLRVQNYEKRILTAAEKTCARSRAELSSLAAKLTALNPMAAISRGYSAVENGSGAIVSSVRSLSAGDEVGIIMSDGRAYATVSRTEPNDRRVGNTDGK
ncbi:MAG: exodeoxyribonuclease VII large subunit [Ruminococcaceae bacterium]|nr:exodeoxyribonuclease VII large subunit [Oscillospiraceae bacterium]